MWVGFLLNISSIDWVVISRLFPLLWIWIIWTMWKSWPRLKSDFVLIPLLESIFWISSSCILTWSSFATSTLPWLIISTLLKTNWRLLFLINVCKLFPFWVMQNYCKPSKRRFKTIMNLWFLKVIWLLTSMCWRPIFTNPPKWLFLSVWTLHSCPMKNILTPCLVCFWWLEVNSVVSTFDLEILLVVVSELFDLVIEKLIVSI